MATIERAMATIRKIHTIKPIEGADQIVNAFVDGWSIVVKKDEFKVGDLGVYFEIDSLLPEREEFEFLRARGLKSNADGRTGFLLRQIRLKGVLSQGLLLPLSILTDQNVSERDDVSSVLGVVKYDPPIPANLTGKIRGNFPSRFPKSNEERIENLFDNIDTVRMIRLVKLEKCDGTSGSYALMDGAFHVCSRNLDLLETEGNTFWAMTKKYDIESKMKSLNLNDVMIQGEVIGEGIQGNPHKIQGQQLRLFNAFDIAKQEWFDYPSFVELAKNLDIPTVPVETDEFYLNDMTVEELILDADGASLLNPQTKREGWVYRSYHNHPEIVGNDYGKISFKAKSNQYNLKLKDENL